MSEAAAGLPAWIELRWPEAVMVREVQLIFDTGLHRILTLSQADGYTAEKSHNAEESIVPIRPRALLISAIAVDSAAHAKRSSLFRALRAFA